MFGTTVRGEREAFALRTMARIVANIAMVLVVHHVCGTARDVVAKQAIAVASRSAATGDRTFARWRSSSVRLTTFASAPGMVCGGGSPRQVAVSGDAGDAAVLEKSPFASERGGQNCLHGRQNYLPTPVGSR